MGIFKGKLVAGFRKYLTYYLFFFSSQCSTQGNCSKSDSQNSGEFLEPFVKTKVGYWNQWNSSMSLKKSPPKIAIHFFPLKTATHLGVSPLVLCRLLEWHVFLPRAEELSVFCPPGFLKKGPSICLSKKGHAFHLPIYPTFQGPNMPNVSFRESCNHAVYFPHIQRREKPRPSMISMVPWNTPSW